MKIPETAKRIPLRPLALGEATGHMHRLVCDSMPVEDAAEMYEHTGDGITQHYLRVTAEGVSLIHATATSDVTVEHQPQTIAPGEYRVVIQEETTDWGQRKVID